MQFFVAIFAYFSVMAAGLKILAVAAHFIAISASGSLQLPAQKAAAEPTLVERRLNAQAAPVMTRPVERIVALQRPATSAAVLAIDLDNAETAYSLDVTPSPILSRIRHVHARAQHSARVAFHDDTGVIKKVPGKRSTNAKRALAFNSKNSKEATAKPSSSKSMSADSRIALAQRRANQASQFVANETPGHLMFKGLFAKES